MINPAFNAVFAQASELSPETTMQRTVAFLAEKDRC
jgi:hypothetical protein